MRWSETRYVVTTRSFYSFLFLANRFLQTSRIVGLLTRGAVRCLRSSSRRWLRRDRRIGHGRRPPRDVCRYTVYRSHSYSRRRSLLTSVAPETAAERSKERARTPTSTWCLLLHRLPFLFLLEAPFVTHISRLGDDCGEIERSGAGTFATTQFWDTTPLKQMKIEVDFEWERWQFTPCFSILHVIWKLHLYVRNYVRTMYSIWRNYTCLIIRGLITRNNVHTSSTISAGLFPQRRVIARERLR